MRLEYGNGHAGGVSMRFRSLLCACVAGVAGACTQPNQPNYRTGCTTEFVYGITVNVVDSVSGAPAGAGATLVVQDGAYSEAITHPATSSNSESFNAAGERPGTYSLSVTRNGYKAWSASGITVTKDACHVKGVAITARLQPAP